LISDVPVKIPESLKGTRTDEVIGIQVLVDPQGKVAAATVLTPTSPALAKAVTEAITQWVYTPTAIRGVRVYTTLIAAVAITYK